MPEPFPLVLQHVLNSILRQFRDPHGSVMPHSAQALDLIEARLLRIVSHRVYDSSATVMDKTYSRLNTAVEGAYLTADYTEQHFSSWFE